MCKLICGSRGLFVAGTDTNVGKTVVAACLVRALSADYWKPVQSGLIFSNDSATVMQLTGIYTNRIHPCTYALQAPLAPHEAARREGINISLENFNFPQSTNPIIVEGAGGLLVPLNDNHFIIDLIIKLHLPIILVTRSGLGTINHTLLSLEILRNRGLTVSAVIMNGPTNAANFIALKQYGKVPVKELPFVSKLDNSTLTTLSNLLIYQGLSL